MLGGNADAEDAAKEYYPAYTNANGTAVAAINTLNLDLSGNDPTPSPGSATYTVSFNGSDIEAPTGFFTYGDGKHNFNSKFTGTYDGMEFTSGLKMEGTTLVQFTTTTTATVTIVQSTWSDHSIKLDDTELLASSATTPTGSQGIRVYTIENVPDGTHQIMRGSGESGIFYVEVKTDGTNSITEVSKTINAPQSELYNLSGQKVSGNYRGIIIENGKKRIQR